MNVIFIITYVNIFILFWLYYYSIALRVYILKCVMFLILLYILLLMRIFLVIISLLFTVAAIYFIRNYFKRGESKKRDFIENNEHRTSMNLTEAELYLFMVDWCPHCKETKEVWDKL